MTTKLEATEPKPQWQITDDFIDSLKSTWDAQRDTPWWDGDSGFLDALKDQLLLCDSLSALEQALSGHRDQINIDDIQRLVQDARVGETRLHNFINHKLGGDPTVAAPPNESFMKAQQVFETAELAEMILLQLGAKDLLSAAQVNKALAASITSSSKLQTQMYLRGDQNAFWSSFFDSFCDGWAHQLYGIECSVSRGRYRGDRYEYNNRGYGSGSRPHEGEVRVQGSLSLKKDEELGQFQYPQLSPKLLTMLLCQPPLTQIWASTTCCSGHSYSPEMEFQGATRPTPIISATGITVRDLLDVVKELNRTHRHCPWAVASQHDRYGEVHANITFTGTMFLRADDPIIGPPTFRAHSGSRDSSNFYDRRRRSPSEPPELKEMRDYMGAKMEAAKEGRPTPSMAEWRTATGRSIIPQDEDGSAHVAENQVAEPETEARQCGKDLSEGDGEGQEGTKSEVDNKEA